MRTLRALVWRQGGVFGKSRWDREFAEELEAHLQDNTAVPPHDTLALQTGDRPR